MVVRKENKVDKQQIRDMWVNALESGEYEQGRLVLHQKVNGKEKFCCLGVLCDLYVENVGDIGVYFDDVTGNYHYGGEIRVLPDKVMDWAGLYNRTGDGVLDGKNVGVPLSVLNDTYRSTFKEIAQAIKEAEHLFISDS